MRAGGLALAVLVLLAAALVFLYQWQETEKDLSRAEASYQKKCDEVERLEEELDEAEEKLGSFGELTELFGYGSNTYYAGTPVLELKAGGSQGKIPIYFGLNGTVRFEASSGDIDGEWSREWEDNWTDVLVTPGSKSGCYTIHFTNEENSAEFDVLVVVR